MGIAYVDWQWWLWDFNRTHLSSDITRCNSSLAKKVLLGATRFLVRAFPPRLYGNPIQIPFICVYILRSFYSMICPYGFSESRQCELPLPIFCPLPSLSSPSLINPLRLVSTLFLYYTVFSFIFGRLPLPLCFLTNYLTSVVIWIEIHIPKA